jgi:hypothetical protein
MIDDRDKRFLSPGERYLREQEEARVQKQREAEQEGRDDVAMEMRANDLGLEMRTDGKVSLRQRGIISAARNPEQKKQEDAVAYLTIGMVGKGIKLAGEIIRALPGGLQEAFGPKAKPQSVASYDSRHEDETHIYETVDVSLKTQQSLEKESAILEAKIKKLESLRDIHARAKLREEIGILAEEYEMRQHPLTHRYVHAVERVLREEKINNRYRNAPCDHLVCVFRVKASATDSMGVKVAVADAFDQNPEEINRSGAHLKGPNGPALHLH